MFLSKRITGGFSLFVCFALLAGCNTPAAQAPTPDLDAVRTQAAQTVVANITLQAAQNPTSTPLAIPTATNLPASPTETLAPNPTAIPALPTMTPTVFATSTSTSSASNSYYPAPTKPTGPDAAQLVSQKFPQSSVFPPGYQFDMVWTIKNVGTKRWNTDYYMKYESGTQFDHKATLVMAPKNVNIGETEDFYIDCLAPSTPGSYTTYWSLINDNGAAFFSVYFNIIVK
ncbi:MAG TPA: NBR1-Ig-like domain-containing protein [Anaerolineaceae bacterium]|nr:NBR1-Ig-like domain-containing protein [Anaerolineaceae bacterium]